MEKPNPRKLFQHIDCISCGFRIKMDLFYEPDSTFEDYIQLQIEAHPLREYHPESQMWNGGMVAPISGGYGSNHDCDSFYIGICDKCAQSGLESGRLIYYTNYMGGGDPLELKKWDSIRNRNKNLDDLV